MTVSVALAAYNASRFVSEQINSVLPQLSSGDELIISLDPSSDGSMEILREYERKNSCVKLLDGSGNGVVKNFENAIKNCSGDIIFLCDQDDVWRADKVERVKREFDETGASLVMHDAQIVDADKSIIKPSFFAEHGTKTGIISNIVRNSYIGCCMAFKKELCDYFLPFPDNIPMHDQWIGLCAERHGGVSLITEPLILYRRHGGNATSDKHASVGKMIGRRIAVIEDLLKG